MTNITINPKAIAKLKQQLAQKLEAGCDRAVEVAKNSVAIDTGRLQASIRRDEAVMRGDRIHCNIITGGTMERGVFYEQSIVAPVDYGLEVEIKNADLRSRLPEMTEAIVDGLQDS